VAVLGNAKKTLKMLTDNVKKNKHDEWVAKFRECDAIENEKIIHKELFPEKAGVNHGGGNSYFRRQNQIMKPFWLPMLASIRWLPRAILNSDIPAAMSPREDLEPWGLACRQVWELSWCAQQNRNCCYWRWRIPDDHSGTWHHCPKQTAGKNYHSQQ
jgi:hypothetical protein